MFPVKKPLEVKMLEDYISDWKKLNGGILLLPKDHLHFDKLFLRSRPIFMDRIFDFSAIVEVTPKERMNEDSKQLHHSLAELSCELSWRGFILKKPRFENYALLKLLQEHISTLRLNNKLVDSLNQSRSVMELLRKTHPDDLCITLSSFTKQLGTAQRGFDSIEALARRYHDPIEITWIISLSKLISRTLSYKRSFIDIVRLMDHISEIVHKVTLVVQNNVPDVNLSE